MCLLIWNLISRRTFAMAPLPDAIGKLWPFFAIHRRSQKSGNCAIGVLLWTCKGQTSSFWSLCTQGHMWVWNPHFFERVGQTQKRCGNGTVAPTPSPSIPDYDRCVKEKNRKKSGRSIVLRTLPVLQQKYPNFCDRGTFAIVIRIGLTGYGRDAVRLLSFRIGIFDLVQKVGIREKSSNFPCRSYRFLPKSINLINH